jgi:6-phosphofructokinase 1
VASKTDVEQAYAVGKAAVELALEGRNAVMVTIERGKGKRYSWSTGEAPLSRVANAEHKLPRNFITRDGFGITDKAREYLSPLIAGEDYPSYSDGIPEYTRLRLESAPRKLRKRFTV